VLDTLDGVGINANHDSVNRLAVSAPATLFNHEGGGHQLKINKATAGETASLLFQTGFGGRAEMGTSGSDDFAIKVSADGGTWHTALRLDAASGLASGAAVQAAVADTTPGRLMATGAFGWGQDGAQAAPVLADLDDPAQPSGSYAVSAATQGARPAGAGAGGCLVLRQGAGDLAQVFFGAGGDVLAFRLRASGVWGAWQALHGGHNVSRVSGPMGEAVRMADGTQICQQVLVLDAPNVAQGAVFAGASETVWTYPATFAPGTRPTLTASATTAAGVWITARAGNATSGALRAMSAQAQGSAPEVVVTAVGRWA
jgi:hypothetical protein